MKKIKTSNIILAVFGIIIIIFVIAQVVSSKPRKNYDNEKYTYSEIKIANTQSYSHLVINTKYNIEVQLSTSNVLKIEKLNSNKYQYDSCDVYIKNDTLFIDSKQYNLRNDLYKLKISIPNVINSITTNNKIDFTNFNQDSLNIICNESDYNLNIDESNIKTINYYGRNSNLIVTSTSNIDNLNFNATGFSKLELNDAIIGSINANPDSTNVVLSGKAIKYYLKK